jgi:hypothetical protein
MALGEYLTENQVEKLAKDIGRYSMAPNMKDNLTSAEYISTGKSILDRLILRIEDTNYSSIYEVPINALKEKLPEIQLMFIYGDVEELIHKHFNKC